MSWDVYIFNAPPSVRAIDQIPADYEPPALGSAADVQQRLRRALPEVDLSDPAWGHLRGPRWTIELNIGSDDPVDSIMLHVRGSGDDVLPEVVRIGAAVGARALDISTGEFLGGEPTTDLAGWHGFQQYRNQILKSQ